MKLSHGFRSRFEFEFAQYLAKNKLMPMACSFCSYKYHCWPKAELHKKIATRAQNRPMVWYTKLVQKDLENCL